MGELSLSFVAPCVLYLFSILDANKVSPVANEAFGKLIDSGSLWRGRGTRLATEQVESSGWPALDECIGGGWPRAALVELLSAGHQGLPLLLPLLARLSAGRRWLGWVAPPHLPFAPGLSAGGIDLRKVLLVQPDSEQQRLWAAEQMLGSGSCAAVMLWPSRLQAAQVRRLQLAAERGDCLGVLFRALRDSAQSSPAALRLKISPSPLGLDIDVLKRRAGWGGQRCCVRLS
jgi:hypothetical protein